MFYQQEISGVYKITHLPTEKFYIGKSNNIGRRWTSHIADLLTDRHSSTELLDLWNSTTITEWTFQILATRDKKEFKLETGFKGKNLKLYFNRELLRMEKNQMCLHSINYCLNKDKKYFS